MLYRVEQHELSEEQMERIATALVEELAPPDGWKPESGRYPLIVAAFQAVLGEDAFPSPEGASSGEND